MDNASVAAIRARRGFSLIELLVVIGIIGMLLGLLLPAIQAARESSRRATCANNLRQIGIGMLTHADSQKSLPIGAEGNGTYGVSFWVNLLPFVEDSELFNRLVRKGENSGEPYLHPTNGSAIDNVNLPYMTCPSSSLEPFWPVGTWDVLMPSYVGISGATNDDGFGETRVSDCCITSPGGQISAGGVLVPNRAITLAEITDGMSHTIAIAECSDYLTGSNGLLYRVDGGFAHGWLSGTRETGIPPNYAPRTPKPTYNLTTIRYPLNERAYGKPGIHNNHGANNPLTSAHPGGLHALHVDGAVTFLSDGISIVELKRLATRDDGEVTE